MRTPRWHWATPFLTVLSALALAGSCASPDDADSLVDPIIQAPSTPRIGGRLVVGTNAEADGLLPAINRWSSPTYMVARAVYDPLATVDENGIAQAYLAESINANEGFTQWTIKLRPNILFHDGTPLTASALDVHFTKIRESAVTRDAIADFASWTVADPLTFVIDMKNPWAHLKVLLASQLGYLPAPTMYDPANTEAASNPVGTGPFTFTSWKQNDRLVVDRNPNYWRKDRFDRPLPYLAQVEFRPVVDDNARTSMLRNGQIDLIHTQSYNEVSSFEKLTREEPNGRIRALLDNSQGAESGIVLNTQSGVFRDRDLRLAAAYAIDRTYITDQMFNGFLELANGPYTDRSRWGTGQEYPRFMPEEAKRLVDAWKATNRKTPVINLTNVSSTDVPVIQRIQRWWTDVGFEVHLSNDDERTGTVKLVYGQSDATHLRFWDRADPDGLFPYFISESIPAKATDLSLNFPRYSSRDVVDPALRAARASTDDTFRRQQYQKVWDDFAQNVPVIFLFHTKWAFGYQSKVHGIGELRLPDATRAEPVTWGNIYLTGVWID